MTSRLTIVVVITTLVLVMPSKRGAAQDSSQQSIDALLNEASQALGNKPETSKESEKPKSGSPSPKKRKPSSATTNNMSESQNAARGQNTATQSTSPSPQSEAQAPLQAIDAARVSEILALDLQAQERERVARSRGVMVHLGLGYDVIPPGYEVEKDDDIFRIAEPMTVSGVAAEATAQIPIDMPMTVGPVATRPFWGLAAGVGFLQGQADVSRRGVTNEDRSYAYQILTTDAGITLGWNLTQRNADNKPDDAATQRHSAQGVWKIWISGGYGADIARQNGSGNFDTFSAVFHGPTAAIGAAWRTSNQYEFFAQYRQRGSLTPTPSQPTRSRLAGRMIVLGLGVPISG